MSRRRRNECCCCCSCGSGCGCCQPKPVMCCTPCCNQMQSCGIGSGSGCGCCGFDPCRLALFLIVLKRACIIDSETGTLLVFLFLLCCGGFRKQGICC